jgi:hypothetical protein
LKRCNKSIANRKAPLDMAKRPILLVPPPRSRDINWSTIDNRTIDWQDGITDERIKQLVDELVADR